MDQDTTVSLVLLFIVTGGALVAFGGLTLFGHHLFFKTRSQAIGALCAGLVILGVMEIRFYASSASFLANQKVVVSYCYLAAERTNPGQRGTQDAGINKSIAACLSKEGYEWSPEHRRCQEAPLAMNEYCYLPTAFFSRLITNFQLLFE